MSKTKKSPSRPSEDIREVVEEFAESRPVRDACSDEEAQSHLRAFISAFVLPDYRPRWREILIDQRPDWDIPLPATYPGDRLAKKQQKVGRVFQLSAIDPRFCQSVPKVDRHQGVFAARFGDRRGVHYAPGETPRKRTVAEADELYLESDDSSFLSFESGRRVVFFAHSAGIWLCERGP